MKKDTLELKIEFKDHLNLKTDLFTICSLKSPHIILWYIGTSGLKIPCANFYREDIIDPILSNNPNANFWLVDLTAWGALKNHNNSIYKFSSISNAINGFKHPRIRCLKSSDFFSKIQSIIDKETILHFQSSLSNPYVWISSASFNNNTINIADIFKNDCPILSRFYEKNTSKSYSMLQYLEGCFLIEELVKQEYLEKNNRNLEIVFFLPNDENKYYQYASNQFAEDLRFVLENHLKKTSNLLKISVNFFSFKYGETEHCRPYNIKGRKLQKNQFNLHHITSIEK